MSDPERESASGHATEATRTTAEATRTTAEQAARKRRRLAEVFGDVLPDTTRDERSSGASSGDDEHLRREVPPHHG